ncbi:Peptidase M16 domain protein [Mannheimia sp. USDA-ARS-USMARC-1261]|uniref:M16 family metallopeptidase n=1 Tax=Mannheimia sp. USDA-ARS-USMARC-1261 TaxID=1432056 RepID=UPI0003E31E55|nr:insulinase family protein [Mannheimia sp. USDA-ARS-USMARC-1261]AHG72696.1 Peptidase M16 domain protein [Mannheimia sp. USDA-ARS-USMARC-1261]
MRFILTAILLMLSAFSLAEKSNPIQGKLDNGLRYTILPLHSEKDHLEIRMKVYAGAVDETDEQAGVAHMVEHLVFRATEKYPDGLMPYLHEQKWVRGRNYNAVTTYDNTSYMLTPPKTSNLEKSLEALSQMLFHAKLTQVDLDVERKIIMEEWRQGQGVGATMNQQRSAAIRADSRYIRSPVIGTPESIANMPASQLQQYYQTWYVPNNMQLLIVGDTNQEEAKTLIKKYFGSLAEKPVPKRDYLDPTLSDRVLINKIQDPRSGISQISYVFRLNDSQTHSQDDLGRFERLVDKLALAALQQRLRNQSGSLPKGVSNILPRKSDIGPNTTAIGLFASVEEKGHLKGLNQLLKEIERIKKFPITAEELEKQKQPIKAQIESAKNHLEDRDFAQWMQRMVDTILVDKPYLTQLEIAMMTQPLLEKITVEDINNRILKWFSAKDRIINYQPPRSTSLTLTKNNVESVEAEVRQLEIIAPEKEAEIEPMSLNSLSSKGKVLNEQIFPEQSVTQFILSNGDKVVWLKSAIAKEKTYFEAQSSAGFKAEGLGVWQSQLASKLIAQNAPLDWEIEQLKRWKEVNKVNLSIKQTETKLIFNATVDNTHFSDLLRLFYAYQVETKVKEGLDETKESISRTIDLQNEKNVENERLRELSKLRFDNEAVNEYLPTKLSLDALTEQDLNSHWKKMMSAPTTYFVLNDLKKSEMVALIEQYLADVPRNKRLNSTKILPVAGQGIVRFAMNPEPKDDVKMWSFTPYKWQGKDAVLVSLLKQIATNKLKLSLRDQHLGVYSLRFESTLNPDTQRVESELSFTTNPEKTDHLIAQAQRVLEGLANQITLDDIKIAKAQFLKAEQERLKEPYTWFSRLMLSENQFGTPQYLNDMQYLADGISLEKIKVMAKNIYNPANKKVFITTPIK